MITLSATPASKASNQKRMPKPPVAASAEVDAAVEAGRTVPLVGDTAASRTENVMAGRVKLRSGAGNLRSLHGRPAPFGYLALSAKMRASFSVILPSWLVSARRTDSLKTW